MKYFFDTEFIESASGIELVSIGIINEKGETFYAESTQFDERKADQWVKDNVLTQLKWRLKYTRQAMDLYHYLFITITDGHCEYEVFGSESHIAEYILHFVGKDENPEFYAYFASYDWVVFARLFGRLIDKPQHFPMFVMDLKQMMVERGLSKAWKQEICPDPEGEHNALVDAIWNKELYKKILEYDAGLKLYKEANP